MARIRVTLVVLVAATLAACGSEATSTTAEGPIFSYLQGEAPPTPGVDQAAAEVGAALYATSCGSCHGADLAGEADWMQRNLDGSFRAPPHDVTGHTWHHSDQLLLEVIRDGGVEGSKMPAYGGALTNEQIMAIIEFLKSTWGEQERAFQWQVTWQQLQREGTSGGAG